MIQMHSILLNSSHIVRQNGKNLEYPMDFVVSPSFLCKTLIIFKLICLCQNEAHSLLTARYIRRTNRDETRKLTVPSIKKNA